MGFWSALGKGLGIAGGAIAAPFTGGASLIPALAAAGGAAASGLAEGKAKERGDQLGAQMAQRAELERALLAREAEKRTARQDALKTAVFSSLLGGYTPGARPPGAPPSAFTGLGEIGGQATREAGSQALRRLLQADLVNQSAMPDMAPVDMNLTKAGLLEKILGGAGLGASAYGALMPPSVKAR